MKSPLSFAVAYNHLPGYLHRWSIGAVGTLFARVHEILAPDGTPYLHNHPFSYVTIALKGGYVEQYLDLPSGTVKTRKVRRWIPAFRHSSCFHRIESVEPETVTLFIGLKTSKPWTLIRHQAISPPESWGMHADGVYSFPDGYRRVRGGVWYRLCATPAEAETTTVISIHQTQHNPVGFHS